MSQKFDWTLLSFQPIDCRPSRSTSAYSGPFAPDFAPGFAPEIYPQPLGFRPKDTTHRPLEGNFRTTLLHSRTNTYPGSAYEYLRNNKPCAQRRVRAGAREGKLFFERLAPASQFTLGDNVTIIGILR